MAKNPGWPACGTEQRPWQPRDLEMVPRSRRAKITSSYAAAVTPQIAGEPSIRLPGPLAADLADAETAIVRFDERMCIQLHRNGP